MNKMGVVMVISSPSTQMMVLVGKGMRFRATRGPPPTNDVQFRAKVEPELIVAYEGICIETLAAPCQRLQLLGSAFYTSSNQEFDPGPLCPGALGFI